MTMRSKAGFRPPTSRYGPGTFRCPYSDSAVLRLISGRQSGLACRAIRGGGTADYHQWGRRGQ